MPKRPHKPSIVRIPQKAATPNKAIKISPTNRPDRLFLLQSWSTTRTQMRNKTIATPPTIFSNMCTLAAGLVYWQDRPAVADLLR